MEDLTRTHRAGLLALAAAVPVAAFVALRAGDDGDEREAPGNARPTATKPNLAPTSTKAPAWASGPDPGPLLAAGKVRTITVSKGDAVGFSADIEGILEIELETSGVRVGELRAEP